MEVQGHCYGTEKSDRCVFSIGIRGSSMVAFVFKKICFVCFFENILPEEESVIETV